MFHVAITLAANFADATPVVTFTEQGPLRDTSPPDMCARILGYAFNAPTNADLTWRLALVPSAAVDIRDASSIALEDNVIAGVAGTFFGKWCGRDGLIVPRQYGIFDNVQPPVNTDFGGETFVLKFETVGLTTEAVFRCWYEIGWTQGNAG